MEERREVKSKGERLRYKQLNTEFQRIARRDKNAFFNEPCLIIEENNKKAKTRDSLQENCKLQGSIPPKEGHNKG